MNPRHLDSRHAMTQTANRAVPADGVQLAWLRVSDMEVRHVETIVIPGDISHALLGNSFLSRLRMKRDNEVMVLKLSY